MKEMQVDKEPMTVESMKIAIDKIRKSSAIPTCIVSEQERQEMFKKLSMQLEEAQECCDILNMEIKEIVENVRNLKNRIDTNLQLATELKNGDDVEVQDIEADYLDKLFTAEKIA